MFVKKTKAIKLLRIVSIIIACSWIMSSLSIAAPQARQAITLSPSSKIDPLVSIERRGDEFTIVEHKKGQIALIESGSFQEDTGFIYLSQLIAQVLIHFNGQISAEALKVLIKKHLAHVDFTRFNWQGLTEKEGVFCLPYTGDNDRQFLLKYYLTDHNADIAEAFQHHTLEKPLSIFPAYGSTQIVCNISETTEQEETAHVPQGSSEDETSAEPPQAGFIAQGNLAVTMLRQFIDAKIKDGQTAELKIALSKEIDAILDRIIRPEYIKEEDIEKAILRLSDRAYYRAIGQKAPIVLPKGREEEWRKKWVAYVQMAYQHIYKHILDIAQQQTRQVPAFVVAHDDFALGTGERKEAVYYCKELLKALQGSLKLEYIFHELACKATSHPITRVIQILLFSENYPEHFPEGLLREELREFIDGEVQHQPAGKQAPEEQQTRYAAIPWDLSLTRKLYVEQLLKRRHALENTFYSKGNSLIIKKAYDIAFSFHKFTELNNSTLYIEHVLSVAETAARWGADEWTVAAAILHRVPPKLVESQLPKARVSGMTISSDEYKRNRSGILAMLKRVDKVCNLPYISDGIRGSTTVQNYMNMIVQMASDPKHSRSKNLHKRFGCRTMLLIFADRLNTLAVARGKEKDALMSEALTVYAPLAERLDLVNTASELRNEVFKVEDREFYDYAVKEIKKKINYTSFDDAHYDLVALSTQLKSILVFNGIEDMETRARVKSPYSCWEAIKAEEKEENDFDEMEDILGVMIITEKKDDYIKAAQILAEQMPQDFTKIDSKDQTLFTTGYDAKHLYYADREDRIYQLIIMDRENFRKYRYGAMYASPGKEPKAHWIYKLEREESVKMLEAEQVFTPDEIVFTGDLVLDFGLLQEHLNGNTYAVYMNQTKHGRKTQVISLPEDAVPVDVAAHPGINIFNHSYTGLEKTEVWKQENLDKSSIKKGPMNRLMDEREKIKTGDIVTMAVQTATHEKTHMRLQKLAENSKHIRPHLLARFAGITEKLLHRKRNNHIKRGKRDIKRHLGRLTEELEDKLLLYVQKLNLADLNELFAAIGAGLVKVSAIQDFLDIRVVREVQVTHAPEAGDIASAFGHADGEEKSFLERVQEVFVKEQQLVIRTILRTDNTLLYRIEGPRLVKKTYLETKLMRVTGVKNVLFFYEGPPEAKKHRFPRIINGQDFNKALAENLRDGGFSEKAAEALQSGAWIYKSGPEGLIKENDEVIEITRKTLSQVLGREVTTRELEDAIINNHEKLHAIMTRGDILQLQRAIKDNLSELQYESLLQHFTNMYGTYPDELTLLEELAANYFMEKFLESEIRLLPHPEPMRGKTRQILNGNTEIGELLEGLFADTFEKLAYYMLQYPEIYITADKLEMLRNTMQDTLLEGKYDEMLRRLQVAYGTFTDEISLLRELVVNYYSEKLMQEAKSPAPELTFTSRETLHTANGYFAIERIIEELFFEKLKDAGYYRSLAESTVKKFADILKVQAFEAARKEEDIIIGLDTSWIPEEQREYIQGLLKEFERVSRKCGLENIIIRSAKGTKLAGIVEEEIKKKNTPVSNVIFLGHYKTLAKGAFDPFRPAGDPKNCALFAGVELPCGNLPANAHIRLFELLRTALYIANNGQIPNNKPFLYIVPEEGRKRILRFVIPRAELFDHKILKEVYTAQKKALVSV